MGTCFCSTTLPRWEHPRAVCRTSAYFPAGETGQAPGWTYVLGQGGACAYAECLPLVPDHVRALIRIPGLLLPPGATAAMAHMTPLVPNVGAHIAECWCWCAAIVRLFLIPLPMLFHVLIR